MKYKNWLKVWLENYVKPVSKQRTYIRYQQVVLNHILPDLGDMEMNGVTPVLLQKVR